MARVVLGLAVGCVSAVVPVYISEIAPADRRGRQVNQNELMIVTGQLVVIYVVNAVLIHLVSGTSSWRWMFGVAVFPAVLLLVGMSLVPETPRWLALNQRYDEAEPVLSSIRPAGAHTDEASRVRKIAQRPSLQSTGLVASASVTASISIGVAGVAAVSVGMYLVGRVGRRPMLLTGFTGTTSALLVLALLFQLPQSTTASILILADMVVFVAFEQCFASTVTWLLLSELFRLKIRGFAMGIVVFVLWMVNFAISQLFPTIKRSAGSTWTFLIFVALGILSLVFVARWVPETKGHEPRGSGSRVPRAVLRTCLPIRQRHTDKPAQCRR